MSNYIRDYQRQKEKNTIFNNPDYLFRLTHKDSFNINLDNQRSRLTGDRSNSLAKNKNTIIIHSNSTSHLRQENLIPSMEKKYNIININVNNLIINNGNNQNIIKNNNDNNILKEKNNYNNNNHINNGKVFSKVGSAIIGKVNNVLNVNKNNKYQNNNKQYLNINKNSNYRSSSQKPNPKIKDKYNNINNNSPNSNIQGVIKDLIETTKSPPPNLNRIDNNKNNNKNNEEKININVIKNNKNVDSQLISDEKIIGLHIKLWEEFLYIELNVDNKNGINNHLKKLLILIEKEFSDNNNNNNLFKNPQLNKVYTKIIKIYFVLITYIKFLLVDFNYEMTIKSNIKRLLSSVSNHLLLILVTHASNDNNLFLKINNDFMEVYTKMLKLKKIKKSKENMSLFCTNMNKNLEISIYIIKQFSNNFFKLGFFISIHTILFDIFLLIDTYKIEEVGNIIINGVLFYLLHNNNGEKKKTTTSPNMISTGSILSNTLTSLGFMDVPGPYLPKLPENIEKDTYTLVLDLDETLVHFFYTPSGGTFLIRPFCFKFLEDMSKIFEIAIFTASTQDYADSILDIIDPSKKLIKYRLYRHHISICGMAFVKDLTKLGRNLNRCIIIDNLADNFKLQPNNGIQCDTWNDDMKDTQLNDLDIILTKIIEKKPQDIKPIIKKLNEEVNKKTKNNMNINPFKELDVNRLFK